MCKSTILFIFDHDCLCFDELYPRFVYEIFVNAIFHLMCYVLLVSKPDPPSCVRRSGYICAAYLFLLHVYTCTGTGWWHMVVGREGRAGVL